MKEMILICHDLLTPTLSPGFPNDAFTSLSLAADTGFIWGRGQLLYQVIGFLRDAAKACPPDSYLVIFALARSLRTRFMATHSNDDYEEATSLLERILGPNEPGECLDGMRDWASSVDTHLASAKSTTFDNPKYSAVTISRLRNLLSSPSVDEEIRLQFTHILAGEVRKRSEHYSLAETQVVQYRSLLLQGSEP